MIYLIAGIQLLGLRVKGQQYLFEIPQTLESKTFIQELKTKAASKRSPILLLL